MHDTLDIRLGTCLRSIAAVEATFVGPADNLGIGGISYSAKEVANEFVILSKSEGSMDMVLIKI